MSMYTLMSGGPILYEYVCMYVCTYVYTYSTYTCMYDELGHVGMRICMYVYVYTYVYCEYVCMSACISVLVDLLE